MKTKEKELLFTRGIRDGIARSLDIDPDTLEEQDGFFSYVFKGRRSHRQVILKISHSNEMTREALAEELRFVAFLKSRGVPVACPLGGLDDPHIVELEDGSGGVFRGACHEFIAGQLFEDVDKDEASLVLAGESLARLHRASVDYVSRPSETCRGDLFHNDDYDFERWLPAQQLGVRRCFQALRDEISALPRDATTFGLTHSDCHDGNIIVTPGGELVFIDFEDSEFHFFINDLAIMVYTFFPPQGEEVGHYARFVFEGLLKGYFRHRPLESRHFEHFSLFLKFRAMMIHVLKAKLARLSGVPEDPAALKKRIARFESDFSDLQALLTLDYGAIAESRSS